MHSEGSPPVQAGSLVLWAPAPGHQAPLPVLPTDPACRLAWPPPLPTLGFHPLLLVFLSGLSSGDLPGLMVLGPLGDPVLAQRLVRAKVPVEGEGAERRWQPPPMPRARPVFSIWAGCPEKEDVGTQQGLEHVGESLGGHRWLGRVSPAMTDQPPGSWAWFLSPPCSCAHLRNGGKGIRRDVAEGV